MTITRPAGMGQSIELPDMDFETYSAAGHAWNVTTGRWSPLPPVTTSKRRGLTTVGAAKYAMHPTTEALSFKYDLKDGRGHRHWTPGVTAPTELFDYLARGGLIEAWNAPFEQWIWNHVCTTRYGWPRIDPHQLRCAMAKARAHALPGGLEAAGEVLGLDVQKDKEGKRLLNKFSMPRNPTKTDPRLRIRLCDDPVDAMALFRYNGTDIEAEAAVSRVVPDLEGMNLSYWLADQDINRRGVYMDAEAIRDATAIVGEAHARYNAELSVITHGCVQKASELQKLTGWLHGRGVHLESMDEDTLDSALEKWEMPDDCRRALEIRKAIGSASVKKLYAMADRLCPDGRLHDLFTYHGARTGRPTGNGPQPTNVLKAGPNVHRCGWLNGRQVDYDGCNRHFGHRMLRCPWCGRMRGPGKAGSWSPEAAQDAFKVIRGASLDSLEYHFGDAMLTVGGCLRGMFVAAPGHDLIASDYSAIEAVVLAALAGEEWRLEVFRTHGKIYETSISRITGIPLEEYLDYAKKNKSHHADRQRGKVAELACFSGETLVLTDRGYVRILEVLATDKLWDGVEWVNHKGLVSKGKRPTLDLAGVKVTPHHPIRLGDSWKAASELVLNERFLCQALATGSANLPSIALSSLRTEGCPQSTFVAVAEGSRTRYQSAIFEKARPLGATNAQNKRAVKLLKNIGITPRFAQTTSIVDGCLIGSRLAYNDAGIRTMRVTKITVDGAFASTRNGSELGENFSRIFLHLKAGITQFLNSIVVKLTRATSRATFDSSRVNRTCSTNEAFKTCNPESITWSDVYDIAHAGPRNRFTVLTNRGPLIVHNSGYQGWLGAWKAFGADEFMSDEEIKHAILAWRAASPNIVEFWGGQVRGWDGFENFGIEGAAVCAIQQPNKPFGYRSIVFETRGDALYCKLPSGRYLTYHRPRLSPSDRKPGTFSISYEGWNTNPKNGAVGWVRMETWGGRFTENIVQAVAHDLQRFSIINQEAAGYPIVLHVYDENVAEVSEGFGSVEEFERLMMLLPEWARGWPIKAAGGWRGKRYRKAE